MVWLEYNIRISPIQGLFPTYTLLLPPADALIPRSIIVCRYGYMPPHFHSSCYLFPYWCVLIGRVVAARDEVRVSLR